MFGLCGPFWSDKCILCKLRTAHTVTVVSELIGGEYVYKKLSCVITIWLVLFYYQLAYSELSYCSIALFVSCLNICFHEYFSACQTFFKSFQLLLFIF